MVDPASAYETVGGMLGRLTSAGFLYLIAVLNLAVLVGTAKLFRDIRRGTYSEEELERELQARGPMWRFFGRFMRSICHSWQLFFVGLVFAIGFDTTAEVVLLAATAYAATSGLPFYAVLALPLLFSGVRKVYYNLVITGLSIAAALLVGTIEILGVLTAEMHLHSVFWDLMANFSINRAGFVIAGLFAVTWATALAVLAFRGLRISRAGSNQALTLAHHPPHESRRWIPVLRRR